MEKHTKPGGWYFFVECVRCNEKVIFADAPPMEKIESPVVKGVSAKCLKCGMEHTYPALQVKRGQTEE